MRYNVLNIFLLIPATLEALSIFLFLVFLQF